MITSIEKLKEVFGDLEINDKQKEVLDTFFQEFSDEIASQYQSKIEELEVALEEASDETLDLEQIRDEIKAEYSEELETEFLQKGEIILEQAREDLAQEFTDKTSVLIEEIYSTLSDKAKTEFYHSEEYNAFQKAKEAMLPFVSNEDVVSLNQKISTLRQEKEELMQENSDAKRKEIISELVQEFEGTQRDAIARFISDGTTEEDIYKRFNTILEALENAKDSSQEEDERDEGFEDDEDDENLDEDEDDLDEEEEDDDDDLVTEDVDILFNSESIEGTKVKKPEYDELQDFDAVGKAIMNRVFK